LDTFCVETAFYNGLLKGREKTGRRGRRGRNLLDDLNERGSCRSRYVGSSLWKRLGPVVRQTAK
jgi:hypothetical protein